MGFGLGGFLLGVLFGAFLSVDGEGGELGGGGFGGVEFAVELGVVLLQPVFAFFGCAAVLTVLYTLLGERTIWRKGVGVLEVVPTSGGRVQTPQYMTCFAGRASAAGATSAMIAVSELAMAASKDKTN